MALGLAVCAVPLSIAVTESLLAIALAFQVWSMLRQRRAPSVPAILWLWIPWAAFEIVSWLSSPEMGAGLGELRFSLR